MAACTLIHRCACKSRPHPRAAFAFGRILPGTHNPGGFMKNIYVGNLGAQTTEDELRSLFGKHGRVERVSILHDHATGRSRGFGFVEMPDDVGAEGELLRV